LSMASSRSANATCLQLAASDCFLQWNALLDLLVALCYSKNYNIAEGSGFRNRLAIARLADKARQIRIALEKKAMVACFLNAHDLLDDVRTSFNFFVLRRNEW